MMSKAVLPYLLLAALIPSCQKRESEPDPSETRPAPVASPARGQPKAMARSVKRAAGLGQMPIPEDNPQTDAKVELGRQLFFDRRLSVDGSRACYSCHQNEDGTGGHEPTAIGAKGKKLTRHSPVLWNVGYLPRLYWDGRAESLEAQALGAWGGGNMGVGKDHLDAKAKDIGKIAGYKEQFDKVFPKQGVTPATIVKAIAAYERTLVCDNTAYDRYARGEMQALDDAQKRGLGLFMGKAACNVCHTPPSFSLATATTEGAYFNVGVGIEGKQEADVDTGRMAVTKRDADWAAFKVPTLRNVAKSAPYFHDGSVKTLQEAVRFMARGGHANKNRTSLVADRRVTDAEIEDLVAFLRALECDGKLEAPKLP